MFYTFIQNNSGGFFDADDDVAPYVIIEAGSAKKANARAMDKGIYFNGVSKGMDCPCCGDRWYTVDMVDATDEPEIYGSKSFEHCSRWVEGHNIIIHYLDGRVERS